MKQVEEDSRLKQAEERLVQHAKDAVAFATELLKILPCDDAESVDEAAKKMLESLDLKAYYESYFQIAVEEHLNDPKFEFFDANVMGIWVRITRGAAETYASLTGKEREEFIQNSYNRLLKTIC